MLIRVLDYLPKRFRLNVDRRIRNFREGYEFLESGVFVRRHQNVLAVLGTPDGDLLIPAHNIVTSAGDDYYAAKATGATPTNAFTLLTVGTGKTATWAKTGTASQYGNLTGPIAGSAQSVDSTYPQKSDPDANNSANAGTNVITWRWSYTKAAFTSATNVTDGVVTTTGPVSGSSSLCGFTFTSAFTKTTDDTLSISLNHSVVGS